MAGLPEIRNCKPYVGESQSAEAVPARFALSRQGVRDTLVAHAQPADAERTCPANVIVSADCAEDADD